MVHRVFSAIGAATLAAIVISAQTNLLVGQTTSKAKRLPAKTAAKSNVPSKTASKSKSKGKTPPRRWMQAQPTPDRYKEIQQALADKGYFAGAVDGAWGSDSTDALKRFQKDQNLEADGKLGSLALIALGLGPKRGVTEPAASAPGAPR